MISREGPAIAVSDINSDGNNDIFFGSASFSKSELYLGTDDGNYILNKNDFFDSDFLNFLSATELKDYDLINKIFNED